jgi:hypothetical protein
MDSVNIQASNSFKAQFTFLNLILQKCIISKLTLWGRSYLEKLIVTHLIKEFPAFRELQYSLPCSQEPITISYPESDESNHNFPLCFCYTHSNFILPSTSRYPPPHLIILNLITLISGKEYRFWGSCYFLPLRSIFSPQHLFSKTLCLCSSKFYTHPEQKAKLRLWGPPSLLSNWYRGLFPWE